MKKDYKNKQPKQSEKGQYLFDQTMQGAKYMFLKKDEDDDAVKPFVVMDEVNKHAAGFIAETMDDGVAFNKVFTLPLEDLTKEPITKDLNEGICVWLELSKNEKFIINK